MDFQEIKIFGDKTLADLFKEIHDNQQDVKIRADEIIDNLQELVSDINNATIVSPLIKDYLDTVVKNNETLIKIAMIVEKSISRQNKQQEETGMFEFNDSELDDIKSVMSKN
jgi:hypothetical protein